MQWRNYIITTNPRLRILRHIAFWLMWWFYLSFTKWYDQLPTLVGQYIPMLGQHVLLKTFLLLIIQSIACYSFMYFLLPRYLVKARWINLAAGISILIVFLLSASLFLHAKIFPVIDSLYSTQPEQLPADLFWISISNGLLNSPKIIAAASIIKLLQYWWHKQKEKENLEAESLVTELQLLKAQIRPVFLLNSLNNIYAFSLAESPRAPEMLLKLSDLLSYMLYECDNPYVTLEKEIEMMKEYITLEKIRQYENIELLISQKGNVSGKMIVPFLLLPFIENSLRHCSNMTEQSWINMDIQIDGTLFSMKLINGIDPDWAGQTDLDASEFSNVQKRLTLLYPEKHELKWSTEQEMFVVLLKIQLDENTILNPNIDSTKVNTAISDSQNHLHVHP